MDGGAAPTLPSKQRRHPLTCLHVSQNTTLAVLRSCYVCALHYMVQVGNSFGSRFPETALTRQRVELYQLRAEGSRTHATLWPLSPAAAYEIPTSLAKIPKLLLYQTNRTCIARRGPREGNKGTHLLKLGNTSAGGHTLEVHQPIQAQPNRTQI